MSLQKINRVSDVRKGHVSFKKEKQTHWCLVNHSSKSDKKTAPLHCALETPNRQANKTYPKGRFLMINKLELDN